MIKMKTIVIFDFTCPKPYTEKTLELEAMGGTEASTIRLIRNLKKHYNIIVVQHNRAEELIESGVTYKTGDRETWPDTIYASITLRTGKLYPYLTDRYKGVKHIVWWHDLFGVYSKEDLAILNNTKAINVFVSRWHKGNFIDAVNAFNHSYIYPKMYFIYNIVEPYCYELGKENIVKKNQFCYISSPHKGIEFALERFKQLTDEQFKGYELIVANPGYYKDKEIRHTGVKVLGNVPHKELMRHVAESKLLLFPNTVFPETFGLVMAEANAVGTPCIVHPIGAQAEVVNDREQMVDCKDLTKFIKQVKLIVDNGYRGKANLEFTEENIVNKWINILEDE